MLKASYFIKKILDWVLHLAKALCCTTRADGVTLREPVREGKVGAGKSKCARRKANSKLTKLNWLRSNWLVWKLTQFRRSSPSHGGTRQPSQLSEAPLSR